jgi:hypothetical protein
VIGGGAFGCNGVTVVGTAADSVGLLGLLNGALGLPDLTGLTDTATIQLSPIDPHIVDVIKIQALVGLVGGSASDTGFGNTYSISAGGTATPEPQSAAFMFMGLLLVSNRWLVRKLQPLWRK